MGLKYKNFKLVVTHSNSNKSKRLRQEYAKVMLDLIDSGKKIINVDQTPIGDSNFHTRGWMPFNER